ENALLKSKHILNSYFVIAAGGFLLHFVSLWTAFMLSVGIRSATAIRGSSKSYAQAHECEHHQCDQGPGGGLSEEQFDEQRQRSRRGRTLGRRVGGRLRRVQRIGIIGLPWRYGWKRVGRTKATSVIKFSDCRGDRHSAVAAITIGSGNLARTRATCCHK